MMEAVLIFDKYWWFILPGLLLGLYAQIKLTSTYGRFSQVPTQNGMSGAEAAREILDRAGLHEVPIGEVEGHLSDHYDPTKRALLLSSENFHGRSLAAMGVAAHEAGHALQHQAAYAPLHLRMALIPVTRIATTAVWWIIILGMFLRWSKLAGIAVIIFGVIALFQLITLPVEFDASRRAKDRLLQLGLVDNQERIGVSKVLNAAAMTYVAAMVAAFMDFLHFFLIARGNDRD